MSTQSIEDLNSRRQSDGKFGRKTHPDAEHVPGLRAPIPDDLDTHEERCEWIARQHGFKVDVAGSENSGIIPLRLTRANGKSIDLDWDTGLYGRETPSPGKVADVLAQGVYDMRDYATVDEWSLFRGSSDPASDARIYTAEQARAARFAEFAGEELDDLVG